MKMENCEIDSEIKRVKLTEQLEKRNRELQQQWEGQHVMSKKNSAFGEDQDNFLVEFREQIKLLANSIAHIIHGDRAKISNEVTRIGSEIQALQNALTSATLFLTSYNVKSGQAALNELRNSLDIVKDKFLAKKKFGFRSKASAQPSKPQSEPTPSETQTEVDAAKTKENDLVKWTIKNRNNEEIIMSGSKVNDQDITISAIENCCVKIIGHAASLQLSNLTNCIILCGPVNRSVFADNCTNCKLVFGCQQLRFHSSNNCDLYMHVTCRAIIEDCKNINVAPFNYTYDNIEDDFVKAGLDLTKNNWMNVADFNWLSIDVPSPNWSRIEEQKRVSDWNAFLNDFRQEILLR